MFWNYARMLYSRNLSLLTVNMKCFEMLGNILLNVEGVKLTVNMKCFEIRFDEIGDLKHSEINRKHEMFWNTSSVLL